MENRNLNVTVLSSTAVTASGNSGDLPNEGALGIKVVVDITAVSGTSPTLTVTIKGKDAASGKYYTILASTALASVATTVLTVYPGMTASANAVANDHVPSIYQITWAIGGSSTPTVTATIGACILQ